MRWYSGQYRVQVSHLSNWQLSQLQQQLLFSVLPQMQRLKITHIQLKTKEMFILGSLIMLFTHKIQNTVKSSSYCVTSEKNEDRKFIETLVKVLNGRAKNWVWTFSFPACHFFSENNIHKCRNKNLFAYCTQKHHDCQEICILKCQFTYEREYLLSIKRKKTVQCI